MIDVELWTQRCLDDLRTLNFSPGTLARYHYLLKRFLTFVNTLGVTSVASLTRDHLQSYRVHVYSSQNSKGRTLKPSSQKNVVAAAIAFVRFLVRHDYLLVDISQGLKTPREGEALPRVILSESETLRLLEGPDTNTVHGVRDRAILEVFYATGMRNNELCSLAIDDLDAGQSLVRILYGKGGKCRWVPMGEEAWCWVEEYLRRGRPQLARGYSHQVLFLNKNGRRFSVNDLACLVGRWGRRVALPKHVTPHCLRHTCATHMLKHGAGLRHLQVMLGHSSVNTTQRYTRVELSELRQVLQRCHPRERLK